MSVEPDSEFVKTQRQLLEVLNKLTASSSERLMIVKAVNEMTEATKLLSIDLEHARNRLDVSMGKLSTSIMSIVSVPIAVILVSAASIFFYFKFISETTWLILLGVACFRYLGDSITAIAKLFGLGRRNGNGNQKNL